MILEGERIRLRPATREDLPVYTRWYGSPEFRHYMGRGGEVLASLTSIPTDEHHFVAETKDGRAIGLVLVARVRTVNRTCELSDLGIGGADDWDKGYGSEMVTLALRFCFRELGMHQVHIVTAEFNDRARRCYGRIFPHQQVHRQHVWEEGRFWDEIYYDITEEEFDARERG